MITGGHLVVMIEKATFIHLAGFIALMEHNVNNVASKLTVNVSHHTTVLSLPLCEQRFDMLCMGSAIFIVLRKFYVQKENASGFLRGEE